ncbi:hypothetical protein HU200_032043 [Digitaria exilis]|uniref:Xylanase inhibitor C-terminal domain-containing protein n=1 Tax=Digitaria exilis TaxID=1010633 RepID=A0A835BN24_9POAL|nr:hypothetical protein HU200_032043 [Digitaria exilis]
MNPCSSIPSGADHASRIHGITLPLLHRHSPCSPLNAAGKQAVQEASSSTDDVFERGDTPAPAPASGVTLPITGIVQLGSQDYTVTVGYGTPPQQLPVDFDTSRARRAMPVRRRSATTTLPELSGDGAGSTPMVDFSRYEYLVQLRVFHVSETEVPATQWNLAALEVGASFTFFRPEIYGALRDEFRRQMSGYPMAPPYRMLDTCYNLTWLPGFEMPAINWIRATETHMSSPSSSTQSSPHSELVPPWSPIGTAGAAPHDRRRRTGGRRRRQKRRDLGVGWGFDGGGPQQREARRRERPTRHEEAYKAAPPSIWTPYLVFSLCRYASYSQASSAAPSLPPPRRAGEVVSWDLEKKDMTCGARYQ